MADPQTREVKEDHECYTLAQLAPKGLLFEDVDDSTPKSTGHRERGSQTLLAYHPGRDSLTTSPSIPYHNESDSVARLASIGNQHERESMTTAPLLNKFSSSASEKSHVGLFAVRRTTEDSQTMPGTKEELCWSVHSVEHDDMLHHRQTSMSLPPDPAPDSCCPGEDQYKKQISPASNNFEPTSQLGLDRDSAMGSSTPEASGSPESNVHLEGRASNVQPPFLDNEAGILKRSPAKVDLLQQCATSGCSASHTSKKSEHATGSRQHTHSGSGSKQRRPRIRPDLERSMSVCNPFDPGLAETVKMAAGYEFMNPFSKNPAGFDISYQSTAAPTTDDKEKYSHPVIHDDKRLGVQLYSKKEDSSMDGSGSDLEHTRSVNIEHWNSNMDLVHEDFQGDAVAAVLTGADCGAFGSEMAKDDDEREVHCINYTDDLKFNPPVPQPPDTPNHERAWNRF